MNLSSAFQSMCQGSAWCVLALLVVGCAAPGEDENYKELQRSPGIFDDEPATRDTYGRAPARPRQITQHASPQDTVAVTAHDAPSRQASASLVSHGDGAFDRSHWPKMTFSPADGRTLDAPSYYGQIPLGDDAIDPLSAPNPVWQMEEALSGAAPGNWDRENLLQLVIDPFAFGATTLSIPVQAIGAPPWDQTLDDD